MSAPIRNVNALPWIRIFLFKNIFWLFSVFNISTNYRETSI